MENQDRHHQSSERMTKLESGLSHVPRQIDQLTNTMADLAKEIRTNRHPTTGTDLVLYSAAEAAKSWQRFAPQSNSGFLWAAIGALAVICGMLGWQVLAK